MTTPQCLIPSLRQFDFGYCPGCRRRLLVQVTPGHWTARCAEPGETAVSTWTGDGGPMSGAR